MSMAHRCRVAGRMITYHRFPDGLLEQNELLGLPKLVDDGRCRHCRHPGCPRKDRRTAEPRAIPPASRSSKLKKEASYFAKQCAWSGRLRLVLQEGVQPRAAFHEGVRDLVDGDGFIQAAMPEEPSYSLNGGRIPKARRSRVLFFQLMGLKGWNGRHGGNVLPPGLLRELEVVRRRS